MPKSWQPLKVLIAAGQALTSRVRCTCLSSIRAKSLPGSTPQVPGHAVARDHALLPSRDGRFVARARTARYVRWIWGACHGGCEHFENELEGFGRDCSA